MFWTDGSVYKGTWKAGDQQGIGLMIFSDGFRKAGKFDKNRFQGPLETIEEAKEFEEENQVELPEVFKEELKEFIQVIKPI